MHVAVEVMLVKHFNHAEEITFSECPTAEVNDKIRGKHVFKILIRAINLFQMSRVNNLDSHFEICVNTVVTTENYKYIAE